MLIVISLIVGGVYSSYAGYINEMSQREYEAQQRYEEQRKLLEQFILHAKPYLEKQRQWAIHYLERSHP